MAAIRILLWGFVVGVLSFAAGYFGPMFLVPQARQGPLIGLFLTGPVGFLAGAGIGFVIELRRIAKVNAAMAAVGRRSGGLGSLDEGP